MKEKITINEKTYDVLFTYEDTNTNLNYVIFTDGTLDKDNNIELYAKRYNKSTFVLSNIETDDELLMLEVLKNDFKRKNNEIK